MDKVQNVLFPARLRHFPHRRWILNLLRAAHIACLSILVGGFFFEQNEALLNPWLLGTLVSGLGIFLVDIYASCIVLFEIRGMSVLLKLGFLALLPYLERDSQSLLLIVLIIFSSIISHSTRSLRHRSFMSKQFLQKYGVRA